MPRDNGLGSPSEKETKIPVAEVGGGDDVDQLIAAAENAAREAQVTAAKEQKQTVSKKREGKAGAAERIDKLQQEIAAFKAEDAGVEDYAWEWVIGPAVAETGIAAPRGIQEALAGLRKTGEALRKLATVEPQTEQLLKTLATLKERHDQLFEKMQVAAVDLLDILKKKYKGEETELIKQLEDLADSPLFRDIKQNEATPEAREKALKQEIVELLLRPMVEQWLGPLEKTLADQQRTKASLDQMTRSAVYNWGAKALCEKYRVYGYRENMSKDQTEVVIQELIKKQEEEINEKIKNIETTLAGQKLSTGFNQALVAEMLSDEHDETVLREAMVDLRGFLEKTNQCMQSGSKNIPTLANPLAKKILGRYFLFGADVPTPRDDYKYQDWRTPVEQMTPQYKRGRYGDYQEREYQNQRYLMKNNVLLGWGKLKLQEEGTKENTEIEGEALTWVTQDWGGGRVLLRGRGEEKFLTGEARFLNMRHAYERVKARLTGGKKEGEEWRNIPPSLKQAEWQESKFGAWVEPGQNPRTVDHEFAQWLERFSAPRITAENAFDARGPDQEFEIYTLGQATDLLRRVRGDVRGALERAARATTEAREVKAGAEAGIEKARGEVAGRVRELQGQLDDLRKQSQGLETRLATATGDAGQWRTKHDIAAVGLKDTQRQLRAASQGQAKLVEKLEAALRIKAGFLGGDKELREKLQEIIDKSKGE